MLAAAKAKTLQTQLLQLPNRHHSDVPDTRASWHYYSNVVSKTANPWRESRFCHTHSKETVVRVYLLYTHPEPCLPPPEPCLPLPAAASTGRQHEQPTAACCKLMLLLLPLRPQGWPANYAAAAGGGYAAAEAPRLASKSSTGWCFCLYCTDTAGGKKCSAAARRMLSATCCSPHHVKTHITRLRAMQACNRERQCKRHTPAARDDADNGGIHIWPYMGDESVVAMQLTE
jgi:hypothetical protein